MRVTFARAFTYWHGGHTQETWPQGEADVPQEVAASAEQCGVLAVRQDKKPGEPQAKKKGK